ncbi:MAG: ATP-binding protein [Desulfobacterales bacterium]
MPMENTAVHADRMMHLSPLSWEVRRKQQIGIHNGQKLQTMGNGEALHKLRAHHIETEMRNGEIRKLQTELRASRDHYADLYDFAPVAYFTISDSGMILESNLTGADMLQTGRSSLLGKPFSHFVTPDSLDTYSFHCRKIFESRTRQSCELRLAKKDGAEFHARLDSVISKSKDGNKPQFRTVVSHIDNPGKGPANGRETEKKLRHEQKMSAIATFARGIAHNFNNMLSIIMGNTELAMEENGNRNSVQGFLEDIMTASLRSKEMITQLLTFTFSAKTKRFPIRIESAVAESLDRLRALLPSNIRLCHDIDNDTNPVMTDLSLIHLIMNNLGSNAVHAMESCGGNLTVSLSNVTLTEDLPSCLQFLKPGPYVKLTVADTGIGMEPEMTERIFDPYFTTKEVGKGTGLGLSIVMGIVQSHEGGISVCSEPGKGSEFSVYLPAARNMPQSNRTSGIIA